MPSFAPRNVKSSLSFAALAAPELDRAVRTTNDKRAIRRAKHNVA